MCGSVRTLISSVDLARITQGACRKFTTGVNRDKALDVRGERAIAPAMPESSSPAEAVSLASQRGQNLPRLVEIMRALLAPNGCPWDREQTYASLRRYVLEEACEVIDAIDDGNMGALREELGDLTLQIVFQSELARSQGLFGVDDVITGICDKLIRRHPHVFGDAIASTPGEVHQNWERIKAEEKAGRGLLDGIPRSLPGLARAQRVGEKVNRVGFDWPDVQGSRAKVTEELSELDEAIRDGDAGAINEELGDVFFALVNLARHVHVDAEASLRHTIDKFVNRFKHVESQVRTHHGGFDLARVSLEVMDGYWEEAKRNSRLAPDDTRASPAPSLAEPEGANSK